MLRAATSWDGLVALVVVAGAGVVLGLPVLILLAVVLWLGAYGVALLRRLGGGQARGRAGPSASASTPRRG